MSVLRWNCAACAQPIADGEGWLQVSRHDRHAARESVLAPPAKWHALHRGCDARLDEPDRHHPIAALRTTDQALRSLAHIAGKTWAHTETDLPELVLLIARAVEAGESGPKSS